VQGSRTGPAGGFPRSPTAPAEAAAPDPDVAAE
jgi:hypothetical protein